jgi:hypothetical protein
MNKELLIKLVYVINGIEPVVFNNTCCYSDITTYLDDADFIVVDYITTERFSHKVFYHEKFGLYILDIDLVTNMIFFKKVKKGVL